MPAGEVSHSDQARIRRAVANAETSSGLTFSVLIGHSGDDDSRGYAENLHAGLSEPARSVFVLCDPVSRALEIVTGAEARRTLEDMECALAAASMQTSFAGGDLIGGLVNGVQQLGEAARAPRTLHASR